MDNTFISAIYKIESGVRLPMLRKSLRKMDQQGVAIETVVCVPEGTTWKSNIDADRVIKVSSGALTAARNRGAAASNGQYIAFVDDDAYPSEDWASTVRSAGIEHDVHAIGGPLVPDWRCGKAEWLPETWHWLIGCGPYYHEPQMVPNTYGSNFIVDRRAFESVGGFDETIGMGSNGPGQGAETDLARRLRQEGFNAVWFEPGAEMYHVINPERLGLLSLLSRAYKQGTAKAELGVEDRESKFIRDEIQATTRRPIKETLVAGLFSMSVGAGLARGKLFS